MDQKIALIFLTYNSENTLQEFITAVKSQDLHFSNILAIDSSSSDGTLDILKKNDINYHSLPVTEFNHGKTRQLAISLVDADIYIFMTHDAILARPDAITNLILAFNNQNVGCAYGRQIPHKNATLLAAHARHFNYPATSEIKFLADKNRLGIKTCFNSDSFAAYRKQTLLAVGGFPDIILGEDVCVAAKMLLAGWGVAYQADAEVYHSHNYSTMQEFKRYFDIGVFHAMNNWLLEEFSSPEGEGFRYLVSELKFCLAKKQYLSLLQSLCHIVAKFCGYKLGRNYKKLPHQICSSLSACKFYWQCIHN